MMYAPALKAALAIPAMVFPAQAPQAPASIITGAASMILSLSQISETLKSGL